MIKHSSINFLLFITLFCCLSYTFPSPVSAASSSISTFNSIGLYWNPADPMDCTVQYRPVGSTIWHSGYPLWYDSRNSECRGSLVNLTPNTSYEIQLSTSNDSTSLTTTTWNDSFPIDPNKTHYLTANSASMLTINDSGSVNGYSLYAPESGKDITIDVQNSQNYAVRVSASYVIVRDLKLTGGIYGIIYLDPGVHDVIIENNELSNWGTGANFQGAIYGGGNYSQTNPNLKRIIVQRNKIFNPRFGSNDWSTGHPSGPQGVVLFNSGGNHVIRYNEIFSDNGNYFNDIVGAGANFETECADFTNCTGFPGPDTDIYANYFANAWDDGIEADGKDRNVRIWGNYIDRTLVKISTAGIFSGPIYIFRNVSGIADAGTTIGGETFLKTGIGNGRIFAFHNTLLNPGGEGIRGGITDAGDQLSNLVTRNNILQTMTANQYAVRDLGTGHYFDVDYDFYNGKLLLNNTLYTPPHGILFTNPGFAVQTFNQATGIGEFYLSPTSGGYHTATPLPNFNDTFSNPDMGAHQSDTPPMEFGVQAYLDNSPSPTPFSHCQPLGDIDCNGKINMLDAGYILLKWNTNDQRSDLNNDTVVNTGDLLLFFSNFSN